MFLQMYQLLIFYWSEEQQTFCVYLEYNNNLQVIKHFISYSIGYMYNLLNNNSLILGAVQSRFPVITENNIENTIKIWPSSDQQYRIRRIRNFTFCISYFCFYYHRYCHKYYFNLLFLLSFTLLFIFTFIIIVTAINVKFSIFRKFLSTVTF